MATPDEGDRETDTLMRVSEQMLRKLAFWHGFATAMICLSAACLVVSWVAPDPVPAVLNLVVLASGIGVLASVVFFLRVNRSLDRTYKRIHELLKAEGRALLARLAEADD